jgi:hypothetical protein
VRREVDGERRPGGGGGVKVKVEDKKGCQRIYISKPVASSSLISQVSLSTIRFIYRAGNLHKNSVHSEWTT